MNFQRYYDLIAESSAPRSYSCLMLDLQFLMPEIQKIHEQICPCDIYDEEPGHHLEKSPHSTILYGIHVSKASDVIPHIDLKPCKLKIGKLSLFETEKYDVLKFSVESADMRAINKQCIENLEYTNKFSDYKIHITVGYLMPATGINYLKLKTPLTGKTCISNKFIFSNQNSEKVWITV